MDRFLELFFNGTILDIVSVAVILTIMWVAWVHRFNRE